MLDEGLPPITALLALSIGLGFVTFLVVSATSFLKIAVVLFIVRNAIGLQGTPPNIVLYAISLALTAFIAAPVGREALAVLSAADVRLASVNDVLRTVELASGPVREFLLRFTQEGDRLVFIEAAQHVWPEGQRSAIASDDFAVLLPSFMIAELKRAFEIGLLVYLPFVVIDLVVTTILMAMGMSAVTPATIATPCKLFLFVTIDGWSLLLHNLLVTYAVPG